MGKNIKTISRYLLIAATVLMFWVLLNCLSLLIFQDSTATILRPRESGGLDVVGFGEVLHAGRVDTETLISSYKNLLEKESLLKKFYSGLS